MIALSGFRHKGKKILEKFESLKIDFVIVNEFLFVDRYFHSKKIKRQIFTISFAVSFMYYVPNVILCQNREMGVSKIM